jgi:hypothetical protein
MATVKVRSYSLRRAASQKVYTVQEKSLRGEVRGAKFKIQGSVGRVGIARHLTFDIFKGGPQPLKAGSRV